MLFLQCSLPLSPLPVAVNCMSFNHNSNLLLTGAVDGMIRLFGKYPIHYYISCMYTCIYQFVLHYTVYLHVCVCVFIDVFQQECLCGWLAHRGGVYNVQFSSDETSVYSMGSDGAFCQWSINKSGEKVSISTSSKDTTITCVCVCVDGSVCCG